MKFNKIKLNLWHRYILYYCAIFIIPFILLIYFVSETTLGKVENQFDNSIKSNLDKSKDILYSQIDELSSISIQISKDSYLSPGKMKHDYYSSLGEEMISRYASSNKIIEDIIISYFSIEDKFYTTNGLYTGKDLLLKKYYKDTNISKSDLNKILNLKVSQLISLPSIDKNGNTKFRLYYVFPMYDYSNNQCGVITYLLNEENLVNMLPEIDKNNKSEIYITNQNNEIILSNTNQLNKSFIDENGIIAKKVLKNRNYSVDKTTYRINTSDLKELDLKFINIVDNENLSLSLISARTKAFIFLSILLVIGLGLILAISYYQYAPIKRINTILNEKTKNQKHKNYKNELTSIELLVSNIIIENEELINKNKFLNEADKNQILLELIEGINISKKQNTFISKLEEKGKGYYIILIKKSQLINGCKADLYKKLSIENDKYNILTIQIPLQDKVGLLVVHKQSNIDMKESLEFVQNKLKVLQEDTYVHSGRMYDDLSKINQSYIEAMIACDYVITSMENKLILYRENNDYQDGTLKYPYDIEEKLEYGIKQGSKEVAQDSLNSIFEFINNNNHYCQEIKIYTFYLIKFITKIASQINFPQEKVNVKELVEYKKLSELELKLTELVNEISDYIISKRNKVRDESIEGVFNEIHNNYRSHDLSLEFIAQKYDYSVPYLSKVIKEETKMTFTKYIQELRFVYVKDMLVETDLPIKEIVYNAGYYDMSNFSRKFKTIVGVTPSQYREINKDKKNLEMA
ncbi:MAG: AraC family transcriptional regulator [Peptostreptococcaceae bacterium]